MSRLQGAASELQKLETELEGTIDSQQQLLSQLKENEQVQQEFAKLTPEDKIYKRLGPALLPQDFHEATDNVAKRLEFIRGDLARVEKKIVELGGARDKLRGEIVALQSAAAGSSS